LSRAIKVEDKVYQELFQIRRREQTFSQVIEDLLNARIKIFELITVLEGQLDYREWQRRQLELLNM